jgi:flagellar biosynthesis protein FlhG
MTAMLQAPASAPGHQDSVPLRQGQVARLVAIASGKGGVGKTWLAITLAQSLAARGRKVLLVDGDLGLANVDIQLGLTPRHDLAALLSGRRGLNDVIMRYATAELPAAAFDILPGRSGASSVATLELGVLGRLLQGIRQLNSYDMVLLDLGAGIDPAMRFMAASADTLLVISTDEPTALADAYAVLKLQARDRNARNETGSGLAADATNDVRLVINQSTSLASGRRTYDVLARACGTFLGQTPSLAGIIRRDGHVADAIRRQTTLLTRHPNTPAAEDVARIAAGLMT